MMGILKCKLLLVTILSVIKIVENHPMSRPLTDIRSDVVVTTGFKFDKKDTKDLELEQNEPGWMRRQLIRVGELTSVVGNKFGGFAQRLTGALDKICEVVKTVIPVIAAVCHVGQFQFCTAMNEAPQELVDALAPGNLDLNIPDK